MIDSSALLVIWLAFTALVVCAVIPFAVWAIRSGQFSRFDYASRLALRSRIVEDRPNGSKPPAESTASGEGTNVSA